MQAINDWQRGGDHKQNVRRGAELKRQAQALPEKFRACDAPCFRQEAHEKGRVWQLLADNRLPETIAAWTTDLTIAKAFKGGVPPHDLQGVSFSPLPPAGSVVVSLAELNRDAGFLAAVEGFKPEIAGFADEIGRYRNSQSEVVLELGNLSVAAVYSFGGDSSSRAQLRIDGHLHSPEELVEFDAACAEAGVPGWRSERGGSAKPECHRPSAAAYRPH